MSAPAMGMGFLPLGDQDDEDPLSQLKKLRDKFQDKNGQPIKLTLEQFVEALSGAGGDADVSAQRSDLETLFKKIDASCTDTVDWEEFTNYYLLHMPGMGVQDSGCELSQTSQGAELMTGVWGTGHNDMISNIIVVKDPGAVSSNNAGGAGGGRRYITSGRDGFVKVWNPNLTIHRAIDVAQNSHTRTWLSSCCWMTRSRRLAVASANFKIYFFDSAFNPTPISWIEHREGTPLCLGYLDKGAYERDHNGREILMVGDNNGSVSIFQFYDSWTEISNEELVFKEFVAQKALHLINFRRGAIRVLRKFQSLEEKRLDQMSSAGSTTFAGVKSRRQYHTDWVTKVEFVPELQAMVTCGLDGDINLCDVHVNNRKSGREGDEKAGSAVRLHKKGVYCFCWCIKHKFFASGGLDRQIIIWNGFTQKAMNHLQGHNAPVIEVICNEAQSQLISMSVDKVVKIWDIRNYRCIQTFTDKTEYRPEDSLTCMAFDEEGPALVMCSSSLNVLPISVKVETSRTHAATIIGILYNEVFHQVVSADNLGTVSVWDTRTGKLEFDFKRTHQDHKLTCIAFDESKRRLYTAGEEGVVKLWNFSSGQHMRSYTMRQPSELTGLLWAREGPNTFVVGLTWDRHIYVWPNSTKQTVEAQYILEDTTGQGHTEDITCISRLSSNTGLLATGGDDGYIVFWKIQESSSGMRYRLSDKSANAPPQSGSKAGSLFDSKAMKKRRPGQRTTGTGTGGVVDKDATSESTAHSPVIGTKDATAGSLNGNGTIKPRTSQAFSAGDTLPPLPLGAIGTEGADFSGGELWPEDLMDESAAMGPPGLERMIVLEHKDYLLSSHSDHVLRLWSIKQSEFLGRLELLGAAPAVPATARETPSKEKAVEVTEGSATARVRRPDADSEPAVSSSFAATPSQGLVRCQTASVTALHADAHSNRWLFTGDSEGWVRVWDLAPVVPGRLPPRHLLRLHEFRAHRMGVSHFEYFELDEQTVVMSASLDCTVVMHTMQGERIGAFSSKGPYWRLAVTPGEKKAWCGAGPVLEEGREEDDRWALSPRRGGKGANPNRLHGRGAAGGSGASGSNRMVTTSQAASGRGVFKELKVSDLTENLKVTEQEKARHQSWKAMREAH